MPEFRITTSTILLPVRSRLCSLASRCENSNLDCICSFETGTVVCLFFPDEARGAHVSALSPHPQNIDSLNILRVQHGCSPTSREKRARCGAPGLRQGTRGTPPI